MRLGDSLESAAGHFRVSVAALLAANGLCDSDLIFIGQQLVIPGDTPPATIISPSLNPTVTPVPK